jgi:lysozyme
MTAGIDVAWPQGSFNWRAMAGRISFGMCKATEDTDLIDPQFDANWAGMWELNPIMPRFAYHFFHAGSDPIVQARHFVGTVKAHGLPPGDNLVADFESTDPDTGLNDGVPPWLFAERGRAFLHEVNALAADHRVLPYANPSFIKAGNCAGMGPWHLWAAEYGVTSPQVVYPWSAWTFWQTGDTPFDTDVFNGTEAELRAFCRMTSTR